MNEEIGPVVDQINETWNCTSFVILVFRKKSQLCIYTKHSSLIISLHEQQTHTFVQFSKLAKKWHFCTLIIVNISKPSPLNPKRFDIQRIL